MNPKYEKQLEEVIDKHLKALPERQAPESMIPGVMAKLQERANRPTWQKPFIEWPRGFQMFFAVAMLGLLVGATFLCAKFWPELPTERVSATLGGWFGKWTVLWDALDALGRAGLLVMKSVGTIGMICFFAFCTVMYLSCVGMGVAWYRIAQQGRA
ncbi:MAG: hypothetical protein SFY81_15335 [Verrucomicrobiota bacterium]|nr:hypothetical protein [Verrucomicrobiota bacterium]